MVPLMAQEMENGIGLHAACVGMHWAGSGSFARAWDCHMGFGFVAVVVVAVVEVSVIVGLKTGSAQVLVMR